MGTGHRRDRLLYQDQVLCQLEQMGDLGASNPYGSRQVGDTVTEKPPPNSNRRHPSPTMVGYLLGLGILSQAEARRILPAEPLSMESLAPPSDQPNPTPKDS